MSRTKAATGCSLAHVSVSGRASRQRESTPSSWYRERGRRVKAEPRRCGLIRAPRYHVLPTVRRASGSRRAVATKPMPSRVMPLVAETDANAAVGRCQPSMQSVNYELYGYTSDGRVSARGADTLTWDGRDRHSGGTFGGTTVSYDFDPVGFRRQRSGAGYVTRYLLEGQFETNNSGAITATDFAGSCWDVARYAGRRLSQPPSRFYPAGRDGCAPNTTSVGLAKMGQETRHDYRRIEPRRRPHLRRHV
jgi:hypothetical protein